MDEEGRDGRKEGRVAIGERGKEATRGRPKQRMKDKRKKTHSPPD
jgi:hypothetical protein